MHRQDEDDEEVIVQGVPYFLSEVLRDDTLQERLTCGGVVCGVDSRLSVSSFHSCVSTCWT